MAEVSDTQFSVLNAKTSQAVPVEYSTLHDQFDNVECLGYTRLRHGSEIEGLGIIPTEMRDRFYVVRLREQIDRCYRLDRVAAFDKTL